MAFDVPNEPDAAIADQATLYSTDLDAIVAGIEGTGVVSGCAVSWSSGLTVSVASGTVGFSGSSVAVSSGDLTADAADADYLRIDIVVVNNSAVKSIVKGTWDSMNRPVMPDIPANSVLLAALYIEPNVTALASNRVMDKRVSTASGSVHTPVTLHADLDSNLLSLSTQELDLDTQTANKVFASATSGGAAKPAFRSLVVADIPTGIADTNVLRVDDAAAASGQYARFTASGLEGRTEAEFKSDFNLEDADIIAVIEGEATLDLTGDVTVAAGKTLSVDAINEKTAAAGVTIEGVLLKDSKALITFTATENDDHALELDVNAAGYGDVNALHIGYITGAIAAGEDEAVLLISINAIAATGGDVFGIEMLATEGSAGIYGLKVGVGIGPVHQDSGTFANPTTGTDNTPSTDVAAMIDGNIGTTTAIFENDNEYILIGAAAAFEEIEFILTQGASGAGIAPTFWYSTAGAHQFTQFSPVDGTNAFKSTGVVAWDASDLTSHAVNTDTGTYDIKIIRTRNNLSTTPILGFAKTAATTEYVWDKDGNLDVLSLTTDTINERTAGAGVILDVVTKVKDGYVYPSVANQVNVYFASTGSAGSGAMIFSGDLNDTLAYAQAADTWQFTIGGTPYLRIDTTGILVDVISELGAATGVTIDGVLIKDGAVDGVDVSALDTAVVKKALFDAQTVLAATSDDTPAALTVTEQTLVGRLTGGNVAAIAIGIADNNILQVDGSPNDDEFARFTAAGIEGLTYAETLAALTGQAGAAFSWNSQNLTAVGALGCGAITSTAGIIAGSNIESDTDDTDDLGTSSKRWKDLWLSKQMNLDPIPDADEEVSGICLERTAGEAISYGELCYIAADGDMNLADASAIATGVVAAICGEAADIANTATGTFLFFGVIRNDAWNWTVGGLVFLSETAGALTQTAPTTADACVVPIGVALSADVLWFNPSQQAIVEHTG